MISRLVDRFSGSSLGAQAARGTMWTTMGFSLSYAVRLFSTLLLTRILAPDVFGLMSLGAVFLSAAVMFSDLGTGPSIVRSPRGDDPDFLRTAWTIQAIRGAGITLLLCVVAWPLSRLYDEPTLFPLLCAVSLTALIDGFGTISIATSQRHLRLFQLTTLDFIGQISTTAINVLAAWQLQSVWALVIGSLSGCVIRLVIGHLWLPRFDHRFRMEREALNEIVNFGRWLLLATFFTYLGGRGIQAMMGTLVDLKELGFITIATTLAWALGELIQKILGSVFFPSLSRIYRERPQDLYRSIGKVKRVITFGVLPVFFLLALLGQPLVDLLYDPRYAKVGAYLSLFAINGSITVVSLPYQNMFLVTGDARFHSVFMFCGSAAKLIGLFVGFHLFGTYGMVVGLGMGSLAAVIAAVIWAQRKGFAHLKQDALSFSAILLLVLYTWEQL